ncbi:MAG TPA: hypothetical protein VF755_29350 [Catenuloplanes sp.]|jgi:ElaB/YqjD/DUF883 family membrane-anchored ribosome-binding protein
MLGTQWFGRRSSAERTAEQAWEYLSSAVGDNASWARRRGTRLTDKATDRVGSAADEAWQRANAAVDALAGRKPRLPWFWVLGAGVAGIALGAVATTAARTALSRRSSITSRDSVTDLDLADDELAGAAGRTGGSGPAAPTGTPDIEIVDVEPPATTVRAHSES